MNNISCVFIGSYDGETYVLTVYEKTYITHKAMTYLAGVYL
jgi:hypothetical protein